MLNQLSSRLPARNKALVTRTFKQAMFRSERPGVWDDAEPASDKPRFSENVLAALRGVMGSACMGACE